MASIDVCRDTFMFGSEEYYGDTGVLEALADKFDTLAKHE
jgi:hypothetical protein